MPDLASRLYAAWTFFISLSTSLNGLKSSMAKAFFILELSDFAVLVMPVMAPENSPLTFFSPAEILSLNFISSVRSVEVSMCHDSYLDYFPFYFFGERLTTASSIATRKKLQP